MIASTDTECADVLNTYISRIITKEDNTNIPSVDPIENVTEDDVLYKLSCCRKKVSPQHQMAIILIC